MRRSLSMTGAMAVERAQANLEKAQSWLDTLEHRLSNAQAARDNAAKHLKSVSSGKEARFFQATTQKRFDSALFRYEFTQRRVLQAKTNLAMAQQALKDAKEKAKKGKAGGQ